MKKIIPALAAVGSACGLAAMPAAALELGELTVHSSLGQPLRASIAYALQPDEQLHEYCVSLKSGVTGSGLPAVSRARISISDNVIRVTGQVPILEPMLGLQLLVDCPYTANLQREYAMFFDFKSAAENRPAEVASISSNFEAAAAAAPVAVVSSTPSGSVATKPAGTPVAAVSRYQVRSGDSLSGIVARIEDRPAGLWPAVEVIFAANPHAFIDGDINLIKAGSWLEIPDLHAALGAQSPAAATIPTRDSIPVQSTIVSGVATPASTATDTSGTEYTPFDSGFAATSSAAEPLAQNSAEVADTIAAMRADELRPGDVILQGDDPFVSPIEESATSTRKDAATVVIPNTDIAQTTVKSDREAIDTRGATGGSWSWLAWLGGAGFAVFLGLLLFGRTLRQRFGSTPVGSGLAAEHARRNSDFGHRSGRSADVDYDFDDSVDDAPSMSLDADLGLGTGLRNTADIDVNQDFGFSASEDFSGNFDFEFPAGAADEPEQHPTDIIPPNRANDACILESEIPPSDDDDDEYDLSMIVDVTRQPVVDTHLTAKDLKAIPVGTTDDEDGPEEYTLSREVDYKILEQDYQEEFTTTLALNEEMAKAAKELAETMGRYSASDDTAEMPARASDDCTAEITSNLPAQPETEITAELTATLIGHGDAVNDGQINDLDDTGVNEELTAELPHADEDVTIEMDVEGGRIDTKKKSRAS